MKFPHVGGGGNDEHRQVGESRGLGGADADDGRRGRFLKNLVDGQPDAAARTRKTISSPNLL
jgi:hypothetical protein